MEKKIKAHYEISLQKWVKLHKSKDPSKFVLFGKNHRIQTETQLLKKFYKIYTLIY